MKSTTTTTANAIGELRAKYPFIRAYSSIMGSFDYWTIGQMQEAEMLNAPADTYRVEGDIFYTMADITNPDLVLRLLNIVSPPSMFDQWYNGKLSGLGSFDVALFKLFLLADNANKDALVKAFPTKFANLKFR